MGREAFIDTSAFGRAAASASLCRVGGQLCAAVVVKSTFALHHGRDAAPVAPEPIVAKLNAVFNEVLADPETAKKLVDLGFVLMGGSAVDYGKRLAAETVKWRKVIQEAKITPPA